MSQSAVALLHWMELADDNMKISQTSTWHKTKPNIVMWWGKTGSWYTSLQNPIVTNSLWSEEGNIIRPGGGIIPGIASAGCWALTWSPYWSPSWGILPRPVGHQSMWWDPRTGTRSPGGTRTCIRQFQSLFPKLEHTRKQKRQNTLSCSCNCNAFGGPSYIHLYSFWLLSITPAQVRCLVTKVKHSTFFNKK